MFLAVTPDFSPSSSLTMYPIRSRRRSSAAGQSGLSKQEVKSSTNRSRRLRYGVSPDFVELSARLTMKLMTKDALRLAVSISVGATAPSSWMAVAC